MICSKRGDVSELDEIQADLSGSQNPILSVFSGGTAFNSIAKDITKWSSRINHILPISDNGGSSREIVRVLGGPAIGDIRSRLIRLASERTEEQKAIKNLLDHRLPFDDRRKAKEEMLSIVDGSHSLWYPNGKLEPFRAGNDESVISEAYKQTVRAFLVHFFDACLRKSSVQEQEFDVISVSNDHLASHAHSFEFDFRGGSIGNFVFTGARLFFNSLEAAIFWFSNLSAIPEHSRVIPVLNVNTRVTIGACLADSTEIIGQDEISHPSRRPRSFSEVLIASPRYSGSRKKLFGVHSLEKIGNRVEKNAAPLPSPIDRIFYVNQFGGEINPPVNRAVLSALSSSQGIIYGMGSLYTSIIPSLVLAGVGQTIRQCNCHKILLLNSCHDRETSGLSAVDYVVAITKALIKNDEEGLSGFSDVEYDRCKGVGYNPKTDGVRLQSTHIQTREYLLEVGATHYLNTIFFVDCENVREQMMSDAIIEELRGVGVRTIPVPGVAMQTTASTVPSTSMQGARKAGDSRSNGNGSLRSSWEFPSLPIDGAKEPGAGASIGRTVSSPEAFKTGMKEKIQIVFDSQRLVEGIKEVVAGGRMESVV